MYTLYTIDHAARQSPFSGTFEEKMWALLFCSQEVAQEWNVYYKFFLCLTKASSMD